MGLPGSGKTTFAARLVKYLSDSNHCIAWFNADEVREKFNDWDFSDSGRMRQATRMSTMASMAETAGQISIADFVCPLPCYRDIFNANITVWMNTIVSGRFANTNAVFVQPTEYNYQITTQDDDAYAEVIRNINEEITLQNTQKG